MGTGNIRAAVVQSATTLFDSRGAVALVDKWAAKARAEGARLVVFPEAYVGGYPKGSTFGGVVGGRTDEGREEFARYHRAAIEVPGPVTDQLGAIASKHGLHLVVGVVERDGGTLYCGVVFLAPDGTLLGKRRKLMPTGAERMVWGFGDGSTMDVHDTALGKLGAVICWENLMPAARMAMYHQGIELYCAPTADGRDSHHATMRHIAQEGRCFVLTANQVMRVADFPADHERPYGDDPDTVVSRGGSSIIGPLGQVLAGPVYDDEALLVADLDMGELARAKYDFDATGHYARPDVFQLHVNWSPQRAVTPRAASSHGGPVQAVSA
ncbi:nitrilase-related carbon-nitrogen hydrolase [Umezawaea sp. Da 62-37]|uniref:nitrilase-related carbon-nitrogen hydrolase n=1 Tax=Umezawaea sp. Da 62-37 TaxID=3075927 RepID=UPI0028F7167B|nr:nitrilase-related carbon-nitrogen hydrolase [Umezawaea sp. Da 62-37]WNV85455.1 nitrilase-related carbon-nitrogen hydrolase [Umezawaea sp. Da 62-37]